MGEAAPLGFAVIGIDHPHIYEQVASLLALGCECVGWQTDGAPRTLGGFLERFPNLRRVDDQRRLLDDPGVALIVTATIPDRRADIAMAAMTHGKDVLSDKPGCTTLGQLGDVQRTVAATGRTWSVCFSERFAVRAVTRAMELIGDGAIGRVVHVVGLGPHRLNKPQRPEWFFDRERSGGILCDLASHQIDQFLILTGSTDASVTASTVANHANPEYPGLEDFGEVLLRSDRATGYARVDWYTPDGLSTWGDGRLTILGTRGYIEIRKYVDLAGRDGTDHLFLVTPEATRYIPCVDAPLPYYPSLVRDVRERTETAMPQAHCFTVMSLALVAQAQAVRLA
jgi:predicted dehydrogenase